MNDGMKIVCGIPLGFALLLCAKFIWDIFVLSMQGFEAWHIAQWLGYSVAISILLCAYGLLYKIFNRQIK
jgi:hypothetical protein